jgi:hypothetical protein
MPFDALTTHRRGVLVGLDDGTERRFNSAAAFVLQLGGEVTLLVAGGPSDSGFTPHGKEASTLLLAYSN